MTGFLQRLAERATGAAQPVRRVSTPLLAPSLIEAVQPLAAAPPGAAMSAAVLDRGPTPSRQAAARAVAPAPDRARVVGTPLDQPGRVNGTAGDSPLDHAATGYHPAAVDGDGTVPASQSVGALLGTRMPPTRRDLPQEPAHPLGGGFRLPPRSNPDGDTDHRITPRPVPSPIPAVEPLLPGPAPAAGRPNPAEHRPDPTGPALGAVQETTEVHISIGRIEVTAVHEPAPAKPAAPRRTAPLSLDDYLAKRHGGRT